MSPARLRYERQALFPIAAAVSCFGLVALLLTGPALIGQAALGPEQLLDRDPLYRLGPLPPLPVSDDYSPVASDYPRDLAFARGLHAGRLDLWNPLVSCGAPLSVEHGGFFFPLKLPFYIAPSRLTYNLFLTLRLFVAGLGGYLLARRRGLEHVPATAAGVAFEMAGATIWTIPFASASAPFLLPWVTLGAFAIADSRTPTSAVGAGLALGLTGTCGHAPTTLMVLAAFGAAVIGHVAASWRDPRKAAAIAALAALASLLGVLLAAPSLLPLAELASLGSSYKTKVDGIVVRTWKLFEARRSLRMVLASGLLGTASKSPLISQVGPVIGVVGVWLAIVGLLRKRLDAALLAVATLGVALTLAPPGLRWIYHLPGLRLIIPINAWPLVLLPLTQAVGEGIQSLCRPRGARVGLFAVVVVAGVSWFLSADAGRWLPGDSLLKATTVGSPAWSFLAPPAVAALVAMTSVAIRRTGLAPLCAVALTAMVIAELLSTMIPITRYRPSGVSTAQPSPAVSFLQDRLGTGEARMVALPFEVGIPHTPMVFGLPDVRGVSALPVRRYYEYRRAISPKAGNFTLQDVPVTRSVLLDLAAVRYVVLPTSEAPGESWPRSGEIDTSLTLVYRGEYVAIYENPAAAPRVRIAHRSSVVPDEQAAYGKVREIGARDGHAADLGLLDEVILEPDGRRDPPRALSARGSPQEYVRIVEQEDPDELGIEARLTQPGYVVIADTYFPGWEARVDGRPSPIYPANLLFRAVFVDAGNHRIVLRYRPILFRWGMISFAIGLALCLWVVRRSSTQGFAEVRRLSRR